MKTKSRKNSILEAAIAVSLLILAGVIYMAIEVNQEKPVVNLSIPRVKTNYKRLPAVKQPRKTSRQNAYKTTKREETLSAKYPEQIHTVRQYFDSVRAQQMEQLRQDIDKNTFENKDEVHGDQAAEGVSARNIYPSEEEINKMEQEKVVLF